MENENLDFSQIKQKAIHGAISLTMRRIIIYVIRAAIINIILPRYLSPSIIGTFNLANTIIGFFGFFADIGLGASIIQKKDLKEEDVRTTFVIQEICVAVIVLLLLITAPFIASFYRLDTGGDVLIRALAISFLFVSLKSIPSVLLERNLNFKPIAIVDVLESAVFSVGVLVLALQGFGLFSYAAAQVASSLIGMVVLYNLSPWRIKIAYSKESAKELLHYGLPFQANAILALLKDRLVVLVVGRIITPTEIGYVTQAQAWAFIPLEVMNIIIRVTFPAYARLQHDRVVLARAIERSLYIMGLFLYPAIAGIVALMPLLISIVGKNKWGVTIPLIYLFSITTFWASISTTFTNVFNAVGEVKLTFRLMIMWTALEWLLTPLLVIEFGYLGVGISSAIISFSSILTIYLMRQIADIAIIKSIGKPILASIIMGSLLFYIARFVLTSKLALIPLIASGGLLYFGIMFAIDRKRLLSETKEILHAIR